MSLRVPWACLMVYGPFQWHDHDFALLLILCLIRGNWQNRNHHISAESDSYGPFPLTGQKTACLRYHSEVIRDTISHRTWLIYLNKGQLLVVILQRWVLTTSVICGSEVLPPQMQNSPPCLCSGAANPASAHHPLVLQMDDSLSQ